MDYLKSKVASHIVEVRELYVNLIFPEFLLRPIGLGISESIGSVQLWRFIKRQKSTIKVLQLDSPRSLATLHYLPQPEDNKHRGNFDSLL